MKRLLKFSLLLPCFFIFLACPRGLDYKNLVQITNNSDYNITVYANAVPQTNENSFYSDTILPKTKMGLEIKSKQIGYYSYNYQYSEKGNDTLSFFIWDTDTALVVPWESIRINYIILQRYDLSYNDLNKLKWKIAYPPTEEMRYVNMYPSFDN